MIARAMSSSVGRRPCGAAAAGARAPSSATGTAGVEEDQRAGRAGADPQSSGVLAAEHVDGVPGQKAEQCCSRIRTSHPGRGVAVESRHEGRLRGSVVQRPAGVDADALPGNEGEGASVNDLAQLPDRVEISRAEARRRREQTRGHRPPTEILRRPEPFDATAPPLPHRGSEGQGRPAGDEPESQIVRREARRRRLWPCRIAHVTTITRDVTRCGSHEHVLAADSDAHDRVIALFRERGAAQLAHPGGTLLDHLRRVYRRLTGYGAGRPLRLAGLCHAAYGTNDAPQRLLADHEASLLSGIIGVEAEALVRLYANFDRAPVHTDFSQDPVVHVDRFTGARRVLTTPLACRLAELTAADALDLARVSADYRRRNGDELVTRLISARRWLSGTAWADFVTTLGPLNGNDTLAESPVSVTGVDHVVLTVDDIDATIAFYQAVLGMHEITFGAGRRALTFGDQKINLHPQAAPIRPHARRPTPGSADLCLLTRTPIDQVVRHLHAVGVPLEEGPVRRTGATSALLSVYIRDPDGNLVEISNTLAATQPGPTADDHVRTGW
jgi:catechol 2,3-dioxygenase-like lactoylglutathione lyase family enzyme